jgi:RNA recognition motif-containing protein
MGVVGWGRLQVSEDVVWELFLQAGPLVNLYLPKDRVSGLHQGYGFVEYRSEEDADYAIKVLNMIKLYGKPIRVNKSSSDKKTLDVGANLFVGNLDRCRSSRHRLTAPDNCRCGIRPKAFTLGPEAPPCAEGD